LKTRQPSRRSLPWRPHGSPVLMRAPIPKQAPIVRQSCAPEPAEQYSPAPALAGPSRRVASAESATPSLRFLSRHALRTPPPRGPCLIRQPGLLGGRRVLDGPSAVAGAPSERAERWVRPLLEPGGVAAWLARGSAQTGSTCSGPPCCFDPDRLMCSRMRGRRQEPRPRLRSICST
jgi:hypothetical protein